MVFYKVAICCIPLLVFTLAGCRKLAEETSAANIDELEYKYSKWGKKGADRFYLAHETGTKAILGGPEKFGEQLLFGVACAGEEYGSTGMEARTKRELLADFHIVDNAKDTYPKKGECIKLFGGDPDKLLKLDENVQKALAQSIVSLGSSCLAAATSAIAVGAFFTTAAPVGAIAAITASVASKTLLVNTIFQIGNCVGAADGAVTAYKDKKINQDRQLFFDVFNTAGELATIDMQNTFTKYKGVKRSYKYIFEDYLKKQKNDPDYSIKASALFIPFLVRAFNQKLHKEYGNEFFDSLKNTSRVYNTIFKEIAGKTGM